MGKIRVRLLLLNLVLVLVPVAGLEFARLYERQLLSSLERDMNNQASLVRSLVEVDLARGVALSEPAHESFVMRAAKSTRTRIRLIEPSFSVVADSHRNGPPEGREPPAPALAGRGAGLSLSGSSPVEGPVVPLVRRHEIGEAFRGNRASATRLREHPPAVLLFVAEPIRHQGRVAGVVYVTRSTQPVLVELHRIRAGLLWVLGVAVSMTALLTLLLAWTLTRPIERLAQAARRIAAGHREVRVPIAGGGELAELSQALSEMTEQLQARHRYISEFAADVAHEFKSPLTSIRGAAELLSEGAADEPEVRARFLRNILLDADRLDQLVSRLLEQSRIESSEEPPTNVDLGEVIGSAVKRCENPDQPIRVVLGANPSVVLGRRRDIETALLNLLDNALRFSPLAASVTVAVESGGDGRELGVSVTDQGPGVSKEHAGKVFDRFFTTNPDGGGTGLGLAIVASVARAHGGRATLDSPTGKGARFTLWLPRALPVTR